MFTDITEDDWHEFFALAKKIAESPGSAADKAAALKAKGREKDEAAWDSGNPGYYRQFSSLFD